MKALDASLQSLRRQVDAAPWLRWAALAIAMLAAALALQALDKLRMERQKAGIEAEQDLRRILALKGQDVWVAREKSARLLRDSLKAQLPEVNTSGMAQAALQNWLRNITANFDNQNVTIRLNRTAPLESMPEVLKVNAALNGNLSPGQALALIRRIESAPNLVVVETMALQSDSSNTLHLTVNAYYRLAAGPTP
jgi:hypothetical protein